MNHFYFEFFLPDWVIIVLGIFLVLLSVNSVLSAYLTWQKYKLFKAENTDV